MITKYGAQLVDASEQKTKHDQENVFDDHNNTFYNTKGKKPTKVW